MSKSVPSIKIEMAPDLTAGKIRLVASQLRQLRKLLDNAAIQNDPIHVRAAAGIAVNALGSAAAALDGAAADVEDLREDEESE